MMKEMTIVKNLDLWVYELPYHTLTNGDILEAKKYNIITQYNLLDNCDYIIGTWDNLLKYTQQYMGYEMNADYLRPLIVKEVRKENESNINS